MDYTSYISNVSAWQDCCRPDKKINFYFLPLTKWFDLDKEEWHDLRPFWSKGATFAVPNAWLEDLHIKYTDQNGQEKSFVINSEREPYRSWGGVGSDKTMQGRILLSLKPGAYTVTVRATLGSQVKRKSEKLTTLSKTISVVVPENGDVIACLIMYELYDYEVDTYLTRYSLKSLKNVELNINKGIIKTRDEHTVTKRGVDCTFSQISASQASSYYKWWRDASSSAKVVVPDGAVGGADVSFANKNDVADSNCRDAQNSEYKPKANAQKTAEELKQERIASLKKSLSNYTTDDLLSGRVAQWEAMYMAETGKYFVKESDYKWTPPDLSEIQPPQSKIVWKNSGYFDVIEPKKPKVKKDKEKIHFTPEELGHVEKEEPKPRAPVKTQEQKLSETLSQQGWVAKADGYKSVSLVGGDPYCEKLVIPDGVTNFWGDDFFSGKPRNVVKEVVFPSSVKWIESGSFKDCENLERVDLSKTGIKTIPKQAFFGCCNLQELIVPHGVNCVYGSAFYECFSLPYITLSDDRIMSVPNEYEEWATRKSVAKHIHDKNSPKGMALMGIEVAVEKKKRVVVPKPAGPVPYCPKPLDLQDLLPKGISKKVSVEKKSQPRLKITTIALSEKTCRLDPQHFEYCRNLKEVDLSKTKITEISDGCFLGCSRLEKVVLPPTVTKIAKDAFWNCLSLKSISLENVTAIEDGAFRNCESLEETDLQNAKQVGEKAFMGCVRLKKISMPQLCKLPAYAFENCHSLKQVDIPLVKEIDARAFRSCGNLEKLELPSIQKIDKSVFYDCWKDLKVFENNSTVPTVITGKYDVKVGL
ncbi:MAG: leucine-rich repeat protein [Clostridia bacterium]|nr:leucine-rich repeat protein [Clostridia bacterium]